MKYIDLVKKHGGKKVAFRNLPESHQMALVWYMAVDGDAWDELFILRGNKTLKRNIRKVLPKYVKKYGHLKFGMVDVPTEAIKAVIEQGFDDDREFKDFDSYHKWYLLGQDIPKHSRTNRWPCILDSSNRPAHWDILEDGWHRLHFYIKDGHKTIPCISYLPKIKYKLD